MLNLTIFTSHHNLTSHFPSLNFIIATVFAVLVLCGACNRQTVEHLSEPSKTAFLPMNVDEDTLVFVNRVRLYVAKNANIGFMSNASCDTFSRIPIEDFEPEKYFSIFEKDSGTASCGLAGQLMVKILLQNGIDSYTYNFGFQESLFSHIVVLVKQNGRLLIFDPFLNYSLLDYNGSEMYLEQLLVQIATDSARVIYSSDTAQCEMLIDLSTLPTYLRPLILSKNCSVISTESVPIRDSVYKIPYLRCFNCNRDSGCVNYVTEFESHLASQTGLTQFHEAFALKINQVYGASDYAEIDTRIDSIIANLPNLKRRVGP